MQNQEAIELPERSRIGHVRSEAKIITRSQIGTYWYSEAKMRALAPDLIMHGH
jgi:hypothetical protein